MTASLEGDVDDGVAAGVLGLLLQARERASASVVPCVRELLELDHPRVGAPAAGPRVALPAHLVDRRAHHLADRANRLQLRQREVGDRQAGREAGRSRRELAQALLRGKRDPARLDACDVLLAKLLRVPTLLALLVVAALDEIKEAHGQPTSRCSALRACSLSAACSRSSPVNASTHFASSSDSRLMTTPRTSCWRSALTLWPSTCRP